MCINRYTCASYSKKQQQQQQQQHALEQLRWACTRGAYHTRYARIFQVAPISQWKTAGKGGHVRAPALEILSRARLASRQSAVSEGAADVFANSGFGGAAARTATTIMGPNFFGLSSRRFFYTTVLLIWCLDACAQVAAAATGDESETQAGGRGHHDDEDDYDLASGTLFVGKLLLVPVLAAIGLKFMALVPVVLAKIFLLSVMNFLSTNLNLIISTLFGMRNFLGKHGLWAHEDNAKPSHSYPEIETFAEWANHPALIQPMENVHYQYVLDTETKPRLMKLQADSSRPAASVYHHLQATPFENKNWVPDAATAAGGERQMKKQRSVGRVGKYKCYWTDEDGQLQMSSHQVNPEEMPAQRASQEAKRRRMDVANNYGFKMRKKPLYLHPEPSNDMRYLKSKFYGQRSVAPMAAGSEPEQSEDDHRQVATTHESADKADDSSSLSEASFLPEAFTQVKVAENYPELLLQQQQQSEILSSKFKDDETEKESTVTSQ
ncbi:unnamed protein product [Trichogramma brassicae]|uniref:Uncharacterized protein n=1 Tax=Trichogramma brassicae TaxID=86971 RepID=A0A6H5I1U9_9HYME|nr:unnamed protein product [Trichogramma brassicae]